MEVDHAANIIRQSVNPEANIIFGSLIDESLVGKLKISIFATGIEETSKSILMYPQIDKETNNTSFPSNDSNTTNSEEEKKENGNTSDTMNLGTIVDEGVTQEGFELTPQLVPDNDNNEKIENVNYDNLHEKKKTSFFDKLTSLMSAEKKNDVNIKDSKKTKKNKTKTDPNLFLFGDNEEHKDILDSPDIVELSQPIENTDNEDLEVPSYLRKGNI
jgi:cell division protein FtsZ